MDFLSLAFTLVVIGMLLDALGKTLRMLMFPGIIFPLPPGITADPSAEYGLLALIQNLNAHALTPQAAIVSATNVNLTAQQVYNGVLIFTAGAGGAWNINLPSTASILAALGNTIQTSGTWCALMFVQNLAVGQTATVVAGDASTTLSGTMTIATNTTRVFLLTVSGPGALTLTNVGSMTV